VRPSTGHRKPLGAVPSMFGHGRTLANLARPVGPDAAVGGWEERVAARVRSRARPLRTEPPITDDSDQHQPLLLTVVQAARVLNIGRTTAYELIAAGELEVVHIGRAARVPADAVHQFVARRRAGVHGYRAGASPAASPHQERPGR